MIPIGAFRQNVNDDQIKNDVKQAIDRCSCNPYTMFLGMQGRFRGLGIIKKYKALANTNSVAALYVGVRYFDKFMREMKDEKAAAEYAALAHEYLLTAYQDETVDYAAHVLYRLMIWYRQTPSKYETGEKLFELFSNNESERRTATLIVLGECARMGLYTERDEDKAKSYFYKSAELDDKFYNRGVAVERLAYLYYSPTCDAERRAKALSWYSTAVIECGVSAGAFGLFRMRVDAGEKEEADMYGRIALNMSDPLATILSLSAIMKSDDIKAVQRASRSLRSMAKCYPEARLASIECDYPIEDADGYEDDLREELYVDLVNIADMFALKRARFCADEIGATQIEKSKVIKTAGILKRNRELAKDYPRAAYIAGLCYLNGCGVAKNQEKAQEYFARAIEGRSYIAFAKYAEIALNNGVGDIDGLLRRLKDDNKYHLYYVIANEYADSKNSYYNEALAFKYYENGALGGDIECIANTALYYLNGTGVERNATTGVAWLEKGAATGDGYCMFILAECLQIGAGIEADIKRAVELYEKAAEEGIGGAALELYYLYRDGNGCKPNAALAFEYLKDAAGSGDSDALYELACCYEKGDMVKRNPKAAATLCLIAANEGNKDAQYKISKYFFEGFGVQQDFAQAARWLRTAESMKEPPPHNPKIRKLF